jgi:hypothetical protein
MFLKTLYKECKDIIFFVQKKKNLHFFKKSVTRPISYSNFSLNLQFVLISTYTDRELEEIFV